MNPLYANVIVDITHEQLDKIFQYRVPDAMTEQIAVGMVVMIPFGLANRLIKGYVTGLTEKPEYEVSKIKEIQELITEGVGVESKLIALASWIRGHYGSTMIQALKTVIPIQKKTKQKEKKQIHLLLEEKEAQEKLAFYRKKNQKARARLLEALIETKELPGELVTGKLNISSATIKSMVEQQVISCEIISVYRNPIDSIHTKKGSHIQLNTSQQLVTEDICRRWNQGEHIPFLIHGVTGSGKTEIYMELIAGVIQEGKQAIVLIPEIALTYQTVMRFYRRFGERISIIHSRLSAGERYDQFEKAKKGLIDVMIGPRSALFTPFPHLGIIIMDEEHEASYNSETMPRYHSREVAVKRGQLEDAMVVMGSATPSLEAYYKAQKGEYGLYELKDRVKESVLPQVYIEDLRKELKAGNRSVLSRRLGDMMEERLGRGEQIMLFLNRRGYAGFLSCRSCGAVLKCPHCDVSLSLHNNGKLVCHYCGYERSKPEKCPQCDSRFLRGFRVGTQQVEELVKKQFPDARILRMDLDTTREKDGHTKILEAFANEEADILIGTQMIVKGHDFPAVTLVGILAADLSLHASDYRAAERTFQLLTQAAGRAGRGSQAGEVVIQTYDPENYAIVAAAKQDYKEFYDEEILYRKLAGYPPTGGMLAIRGSCENQKQLELAMDYLKKYLENLENRAGIGIIGPADEAVSKINDIYRKVIYIKHKNSQMLTKIKDMVEQYIEINSGYDTIGIQYDVE